MSNILTDTIKEQAAKYGAREAIVAVNGKGERTDALTYEQLAQQVEYAACAMETLGLQPQEAVAVFSANRPDMVVTDFACYYCRIVPVSIYSTSSPDQVKYIVNDAKARMIFVGDRHQYDVVCSIASECPSLSHIILYTDDITPLEGCRVPAMKYSHLISLGRNASDMCRQEVERRRTSSTPEDIATLIYTSGTTGEPKGAVLPHRCFNAVVDIHHRRLTMLSDKDTSLCFLPLSHIFEKAWTYFCITQGIHVSVNVNAKEIADTIRKVRPTCMCSVPRFWEKVYAGINEKLTEAGGGKRIFAKTALKIGRIRNLKYARTGRKAPWHIEMLYNFFNKNLFRKVAHIVGIDNGNIFPTAGAPISAEIVEFFHAMGVNMVVGYGLSETTATVTCFPETDYVIGSVGTVMPEVNVRISPDGEIEVKAPTVMDCYYNKPKETEEAFTADGWFRTGDAGYFDEKGALVLTERIKDLFKTSNGKYIAPQALESRLGGDRYIEQVAVLGESRKYVTAIIIPAFEAIKDYALRKGIKFKSLDDLIQNSEIIKLIGERIDRLQKNLPSFEQIKKFTLLPKAFTIESGELTNTLKIRRPVINRHYAKEIEAMYAV